MRLSLFQKKLLNFKKHVARLRKSLNGLKISSPFRNFKSLELIILNLIGLLILQIQDLFICKLLEVVQKKSLISKNTNPNIVIFTFSQKNINNLLNGVNVETSEDLRWYRCDIKIISIVTKPIRKTKAIR